MARQKSNQKLVEHLKKHLDSTASDLRYCVNTKQYLKASFLQEHYDCLVDALAHCGVMGDENKEEGGTNGIIGSQTVKDVP
jgi:hypothetical protein